MIVDFRDSFIEWQTNEDSFGRFAAEALLKFKGKDYLLGSSVLACNVYGEQNIFKDPAYYFQPLFSNSAQKIYRSFVNSQPDNDTNWKQIPEFKNVNCKIAELQDYTRIKDFSVLEQYYNAGACFQTVVRTADFEAQFPVKHINIHFKNKKFQVETGPVVLANGADILKAHTAFNTFKRIEFLAEKAEDHKKTYSEPFVFEAEVELIKI